LISNYFAGNFTQLIWISSKRLGISVARAASGKFYVVANYDPPGNILGQFDRNVPPIGQVHISYI